MIRGANSMGIRRFAALCTAISIGAVVTACDDDPITPEEGQAFVVLDKGLNAYLVVSSDKARTGSTISVEAHVRVVGEDLNPTAFLANLRYDAERLEPIAVIAQKDNVVRAVNLEAGPGLIRAAGAAANGLGTEILVALTMMDTPTIAVAQTSDSTQLLGTARRRSGGVLPRLLVCLAIQETSWLQA